MGYRTFVSIKIALIGTGAAVEAYAKRYANAGHEVLLACVNNDIKMSAALSVYNNISACTIEVAAAASDLIIIATPPAQVREVAYWLGDVRRKVIIDATPNIHTAAEDQVNTFYAIKSITGAQHIVKVFSTRGYEKLLKPIFGHDNLQLLLAGDSKKAKEVVKILTIDLGTRIFFDFGDSTVIPLFNEMAAGWRKLILAKENALIPVKAKI